MNTWRKTVLLFQPSRFQASIWRSILSSQNIFLIWQAEFTSERQIANYFKVSESRPNLIIIDLKINNAYELCRWCSQNYPRTKIILTVDSTSGYSPVIRRWAVNQGVEELLINFQQPDLLSSVITNVSCVLKVLDCQPAKKATIIRALRSIDQKMIVASQKIANSTNSSPSIITTTTVKSSTTGYSFSLVIVILLLITISLDIGMLWFILPVQGLQRKVLVQIEKQAAKSTTKPTFLKDVKNIPRGIFNYGGSTTWAPIRKIVDLEIEKEYPEFNLRYLPAINAKPGSGIGIRMLLEGELDFAQSSRLIKQEEHLLAHQQGYTLGQYHIAIDAIAIAVNPSLSIYGLTVEQLQKIYTGEITNWSEVGGPNVPIIAFSRRPEDGGTAEFFQNHILQNQPFGSGVKYVYSTTDGLRQIGRMLGGIYYGSAPEVVPQCTVKSLPIANNNRIFIPPYRPPAVSPYLCPKERNRLNVAAIRNASYPMTRYLSTVVKQDEGRAQKVGETYTKLLLTAEMQKLIKKAGFVPIH